MSTAWVLMTAMPPTVGHLHLIQFAARTADQATVLICTQPGEPYPQQRVDAVRRAVAPLGNVTVEHLHAVMPQEPGDDPHFWDTWMAVLRSYGMRTGGDVIVASEAYGAVIAELSNNEFLPYDIDRAIHPARASRVRRQPLEHFADVLAEFQPVLRKRITVFGAESTGKTTLSRALAESAHGHWLPEWARPYLKQTPTPDVTLDRMNAIWRGQRALQLHADDFADRPFIIQDTDLFSTVGYWMNWDAASMPPSLIDDAVSLASDLYLITRSNIAFEPDPLRYGGDRRETPDDYWIGLAERYQLPYTVVDAADRDERVAEATELVVTLFEQSAGLDYTRIGEH